MTYAFQTPVGRPVEVRPADDIPAVEPDKWQVLSALTEAAGAFGLGHRPLCVLRALLTFLPERHIPDGQRAIVFPANATLSARLGGMPESTLRRHLATLVTAGFVSLHDSPNRERYAKRTKSHIALAFGFDLSPLVSRARAILTAATDAREQEERLAVLRARVLSLRHDLRQNARAGEAEVICCDFTRALRRKLTEADLRAWLSRLENELATLATNQTETPDLSGSSHQNARHIHGEKRSNSDSEANVLTESSGENFPMKKTKTS